MGVGKLMQHIPQDGLVGSTDTGVRQLMQDNWYWNNRHGSGTTSTGMGKCSESFPTI
jgi:hypothetical protein